MNVDLSTYNNDWYKPGSLVKRVFWYWVNIIFFKSSIFPFYGLKIFLLKLFGAKVGKEVCIKPNVNIKYPWLLCIGDYTWIGEQVWIDNLAMVTIGKNVCVSQGALLLCGNHDYTKVSFDLIVKPIILEDGVWIGAKSTVFGGAFCKSHSVFSSASLIIKEYEAFSVYTGNPLVKVKDRVIG
jgi:putative colanic acid biosynthesis acetyltransferase WcaF